MSFSAAFGNSSSLSTSARRRPSVATIVSFSSLKLMSTPLSVRRVSSCDAAYAVFLSISLIVAWGTVYIYASPSSGIEGNSEPGIPCSLKRALPALIVALSCASHSTVISPSAAFVIEVKRSFTGSVVTPSSVTSHSTSDFIDMSRSVVVSLMEFPLPSIITFCRMGSDPFPATMFCTLLRPSMNFDLRTLNFIFFPFCAKDLLPSHRRFYHINVGFKIDRLTFLGLLTM